MYLLSHNSRRWSDAYRLNPDHSVTLGRSTDNPIVVHDDAASRRHAEVFFDGDADGWMIRDLGSRNGTFVDDVRIEHAVNLQPGSTIRVAGLSVVFSDSPVRSPRDAADGTAGQTGHANHSSGTSVAATVELDPASITARRRTSSLGTEASGDAELAARSSLLRLSLDVGRAESIDDVFDLVISDLIKHTAAESVAIIAGENWPPPSGNHSDASARNSTCNGVLAMRHRTTSAPDRSSSPRPDDTANSIPSASTESARIKLARSILVVDRPAAILARNIIDGGDAKSPAHSLTLSALGVESLILCPVQSIAPEPTEAEPSNAEASNSDASGPGSQTIPAVTIPAVAIPAVAIPAVLMLTGDSRLSAADLDRAVAVCEIVALRAESLIGQTRLQRRLGDAERQIRWLHQALGSRVRLIGQSPAMVEIARQIELVAPTRSTVLIRGESGVGKELIAAAMHHAGGSSDGPMVTMNCAALSPTLLEAELFGYEKNAFTGAETRRVGKFEAADGGTLFLDEIGEMTAETQAKVLRVLEDRTFQRVGGSDSISVNVRLLAATNRDLWAMVEDGSFRKDLYYRLHVVEIVVPPLRKRGEDVLLLARHFVTRLSRECGRVPPQLDASAQRRLMSHDWPGNIRELRNVIERAVVLSPGEILGAGDLLIGASPDADTSAAADASSAATAPVDPETSLADLERQHVARVLEHTGGNKSRAAAILGIERSTLDRKLKRYAAAT